MIEDKRNIVLIGMPTSGKTTVGKILAGHTGRTVIDTDDLVAARVGCPVPQYVAEHGEPPFRAIEKECVAEAAAQSGIIVSTGGGVILDPDNVAALKKTGILFFLDRPLALLRPASDRPLSSSADKLTAMFEVRYPFYCAAADHRIRADRTPEEEAAQILKAFSE